jgi:DNA-binding IclR family transcriptional regulator
MAPVSVVGRAMAVLTCFRAQDVGLSQAEIARRTGLTPPTVHRLVSELARWGMVERTSDGVRLGMHLFELGQLAPRQRWLREAAAPFLKDLYQATGETVHMAVLDGSEVVYLEKLVGSRGTSVPTRVGGRWPAHSTALGKALLAFAPEAVRRAVLDGELTRLTPYTKVTSGLLERELLNVRRDGLAFEHEESVAGVVCVACPVLGDDGTAMAAISVTGWSTELDAARMAPAVQTAALGLSRQLRSRSLG